jgi:protein TonB
MFEDDDQQATFFSRHRAAVTTGTLVAVAAAGVTAWTFLDQPKVAAQREEIISAPRKPPVIVLSTPAPTPQPTATSTPEPMETPVLAGPESQTNSPAPRTNGLAATPGPISTTIAPGAGGWLADSGPGIGGDSDGTIGGGGGKYGAFAAVVQERITAALKSNARTRIASLNFTARIWPDATGRIVKAKLSPGTGDRALDDLIQNQILTGMQLGSAPPPGMPVPIVMTVSIRRP